MQYRATSLCVVRRSEELLLEQFPEADGMILFRPVGGTIEYGEDSRSTVVREVKEEIGIDIIEPKLLGIIENIYPNSPEQIAHEYAFIYQASFKHTEDYSKDVFEGIEEIKRQLVVWKNLNDFKENPHYKLVPDGLYEMLMGEHDSITDILSDIKHVNTKGLQGFA